MVSLSHAVLEARTGVARGCRTAYRRNFSPQETDEISVDMGRIWYRSEEREKLGTILFTLLGLSDLYGWGK